MTVAVLFGGPSPEHDVSVLLGLQAARALGGAGHTVEAVYWSKSAEFAAVDASLEAADFADGTPRRARPLRLVTGPGGGFVGEGGPLRKEKPLELRAVVNCCHGGPGEDGSLQAALDLAGIRYTGPTALGAALGMDKLAFGAVVQAAGLPSLPRSVVDGASDWTPGFDGPYLVKPRFGGSSIGIEVVNDAATAQALSSSSIHLRAGAVIEPFRADAVDLNVAMRSWPALELSAIERPVRSGASAILSYADKYVAGSGMSEAPRELPAVLDAALEQRLRDAAAAVARLVGLRGVARLDFLLDGDDLYVNEINTVPGSMAKHLWIDPPIAFADLLAAMVDEAERRPAIAYSSAGADGAVLRTAGSISSKLG